MPGTKRTTRFRGALALCAVAAMTAACSSSSDSGSTASGATDSPAATAAGSASAKTGVPKKMIGILKLTGTSESTNRPQDAAIEAIEQAGWDYKMIDAQGDPQKSAAGLNSFVNEGVDAVISIANQPSSMQDGLKAAGAKGIPVINIAGTVPEDPNLAGNYAPDELALTGALDTYMFDHVGPSAKIATLSAPAIYALRLRDDFLTDDIKDEDAEIVANHEVDFTNPIQDTQKAVTDMLTANPDITAFWTDTDFEVQPTAQVLKSKGLCGKVQVYGYYANSANMATLRDADGCATAVVETAIDASGYMAVDALLGFFVDGTAIPPTPEYDQDFFAPTMIDASNVPAESDGLVPPPVDYKAFFSSKWADAYGI